MNERLLWHGTSPNSADCIVIQGFDIRVGVQNGRVHGNGVYMTVNPMIAYYYATSKCLDSTRLILCKPNLIETLPL